MLREMATDLASSVRVTNPHDVDTVDRTKGWNDLAASGLLGLRTRDGGAPTASGVEVMLATEALAEALAPLPFVGTTLALELLSLVGAPSAWTDAIADGSARYGLVLTHDLSALASVDALDGGYAWDVDGAAYALALSGSQVVRIALDRVVTRDAIDLTRTLAEFESGAVEPAGELIGDAWSKWLAFALTVVAADTVGLMRSGLMTAVEYSKERIAYDVPIGSFQALQHMCAEAFVSVEASSSATKYAAWAVDELSADDALLAARAAKAYSSSVVREVTERVMQMFGGIGQTWEHIAHLFNRRGLFNAALLGDADSHYLAIADARLVKGN